MNRATFLTLLLGLFGALAVLIKFPFSGIQAKKNLTAKPGKGLDDTGLKTLVLMSECIFPSDTSPGAVELGIEEYFRRQLSTPYYQQHALSLKKAVEIADRAAMALAGRPFHQLGRNRRTEVMARFAAGELAGNSGECKRLFSAVTDLTLEGCFSHPRHGGNLGGRAWRIMQDALEERWFNA